MTVDPPLGVGGNILESDEGEGLGPYTQLTGQRKFHRRHGF